MDRKPQRASEELRTPSLSKEIWQRQDTPVDLLSKYLKRMAEFRFGVSFDLNRTIKSSVRFRKWLICSQLYHFHKDTSANQFFPLVGVRVVDSPGLSSPGGVGVKVFAYLLLVSNNFLPISWDSFAFSSGITGILGSFFIVSSNLFPFSCLLSPTRLVWRFSRSYADCRFIKLS